MYICMNCNYKGTDIIYYKQIIRQRANLLHYMHKVIDWNKSDSNGQAYLSIYKEHNWSTHSCKHKFVVHCFG